MFGKNSHPPGSSQTAGPNAIAIQTGGDFHLHKTENNIEGVTLGQVLEVCQFFLENNFPKLQEIAHLKAQQHVSEFANKLAGEMHKEATKVLLEKFTDPDVQAAINDAVKNCARKGEQASPEILAKLIVGRMGDNTPFVDTVIGEAINVVPKLSKEQIAFVLYVHYMRAVFLAQPSFESIEIFAKKITPLIQPGLGLSVAQKLHLQYAGVMSINNFSSGDIFEPVLNEYGPKLGIENVGDFKRAMVAHCPSYNSLLEEFDKNETFKPGLSSVGIAIAVITMKSVLPADIKIWLN